jgi:hypothetical protein
VVIICPAGHERVKVRGDMLVKTVVFGDVITWNIVGGVQCLERICTLIFEGGSFLPSRRQLAYSVKKLISVNHSTFQKNRMMGDFCP